MPLLRYNNTEIKKGHTMPKDTNDLAKYLKDIKDIGSASNTEHSKRTQLENLLNYLLAEFNEKYASKGDDKIYIKQESSRTDTSNDEKALGTPDFRVSKINGDASGLTLGYIENKKVDKNLQELIDTANKDENAQIAKYLELSPNLILTDYLRFWRVRKDKKDKFYALDNEKVQICELNDLPKFTNQKAVQEKENKLLELFKDFFLSEVKVISTADDFTNKLALRTRELKNAIIEQ